MYKKRGKNVMITGPSSGIGLELARVFAKKGFDLILVARSKDILELLATELRNKYSVNVIVIPKDLADPSAPEKIFSELQERGTNVDILINNAGFGLHGPFADSDTRVILEMIQVNLVALTHLTKLFLPGMIDRRYGRIMNLGSTSSFVPVPLEAIYGATKAYILNFSESISEELVGTGVTVTALCPGFTETGFFERAKWGKTNIFKFGVADARSVAEAGYKALMRRRRVSITGLNNKALIFSTRFSSRIIVSKLLKYLNQS
ncbi:MAG: SDR family NAD(P)-dependent oxidoreductase [Acidobacteriota bacterium]